MRKAVLMLLSLIWLLVGCSSEKQSNAEIYEDEETCSCPHATICLQPLGDFTQAEAKTLKRDLDKHLDHLLYGAFTVEVLHNKQLTASMLNESKTRYFASKIIRSLQKDADAHKIIVALTHKDISVARNGKNDWGVCGLSIPSSHTCVVSTYRVKNAKRDFWKVTTHEFIHTFYHFPHCPKDNPACIMKDAKGHPNFAVQDTVCCIL